MCEITLIRALGLDVLRCSLLPLLQPNAGTNFLSHSVVLHSYHLHFLHLRVCVKEVLEFRGVDVLATPDDHILGAAHNFAEALLIHHGDVSARKGQEWPLTSASVGPLTHSFIKHLVSIYYVSRTVLNSGGYSMNKIFPGTYSLVWEADKHKPISTTFSLSQHIYTYAFHGWLLFYHSGLSSNVSILRRPLTTQYKKTFPPYDSHFLSSDLILFSSFLSMSEIILFIFVSVHQTCGK